MTAGDIVERIRKNVGVPWRDTTFRDTFKSGSAATTVTGVATTAFASFDVVRRAVAECLNMIVPHEVTFWNDRDDIGFNDLIAAGSVFVGLDTFLGPLYAAYGRAEGGHGSFYFFLGRVF